MMLFGLAIVICIYGVLIVTSMERLRRYRAEAEIAEVNWNVSAIRSSLYTEVLRRVMRGKEREIPALIGDNPMRYLDKLPTNYLGELDRPDVTTLPTGNWYFDKGEIELVYLLKNGKYLENQYPNMLKFKVKFTGLPKNPAKPQDVPPRAKGVVLERVQ